MMWIVYPDEVKQKLLFKVFVCLTVNVISKGRGKIDAFANKHNIHSIFWSLLLTFVKGPQLWV